MRVFGHLTCIPCLGMPPIGAHVHPLVEVVEAVCLYPKGECGSMWLRRERFYSSWARDENLAL
jgi:hypothetical protein